MICRQQKIQEKIEELDGHLVALSAMSGPPPLSAPGWKRGTHQASTPSHRIATPGWAGGTDVGREEWSAVETWFSAFYHFSPNHLGALGGSRSKNSGHWLDLIVSPPLED